MSTTEELTPDLGSRLAPETAGEPAVPAGDASSPGPAPDGHPPLRRNVAFQTLWAGSAAASLGLAVADVAYPLAILTLTGSPATAGLFAAVQTAGVILAGLPAGQLADRHSPRRLLAAAEAVRVVVTVVVTVALITGMAATALLLAAALLLGAGQSFVMTTRQLLVRLVVPAEQLTSALTQDEVRINGAELAGPPLGGALYGLRVLAHAVPFVFAALSFGVSLVSALAVRSLPQAGLAAVPAEPAAEDRTAGTGMLAGIRAILGNPVLRATTLLLAMVNSVGVSLGLIAVVILRAQAVSPAMIGLALAGAAAGGLAGALLVRPLHRLRPGVLLISMCVVFVPLIALLAVPAGPWWMAGVLFLAMLGVPSVRVLLDVLILRQAPQAERGRIVAAVMMVLSAGMPAGLAVSGLLLQYLSATITMLAMAGVLAIATAWAASSSTLRQARWPQ